MLYGYSRLHAFPDLITDPNSVGLTLGGAVDYQDLMYPFLAIEFTGESGSLWVATNRCLVASASCVKIAEYLNFLLSLRRERSKVEPIDSTVFSIAMNGTEARLYVTWKDRIGFNMQKVDSFILQKPKDHIEFRNHVENIIDWGKDQRLKGIQDAVDAVMGKRK